jgi:predicted secreted protein
MARLVLTDANVLFATSPGNAATNDISAFITSLSLSTSYDVIDTTGISTTGAARTRVAGLADNSITIEFNNDYADNSLEELINGTTTTNGTVGLVVAMQVKPTSGATSASNPKYNFNVLVAEWQPLSGAVGELSTASVTWPISGPITKSITP